MTVYIVCQEKNNTIYRVKDLFDLLVHSRETFEKYFALSAGFKFKSKIPDLERGKTKILTTPLEKPTGQASIPGVFRVPLFSWMSLTLKLGKRGCFSKVSSTTLDITIHLFQYFFKPFI